VRLMLGMLLTCYVICHVTCYMTCYVILSVTLSVTRRTELGGVLLMKPDDVALTGAVEGWYRFQRGRYVPGFFVGDFPAYD